MNSTRPPGGHSGGGIPLHLLLGIIAAGAGSQSSLDAGVRAAAVVIVILVVVTGTSWWKKRALWWPGRATT
ncbi:hypothetical protein ACFWM0_03430 [Streptomyces sp. NPDC058405]|uniref:hypothetical protein n=1 Tax=Streptomyces sp. NPDC058405 TaxID=3346482 RepID=UPI0036634801